jgi:parvulin-like peptidyl-prolyl isomerase
MKLRFPICIPLLCAITAAAQLPPSHAPTVAAASAPPWSAAMPVARVNDTILTDRDLMRQMINDFPYAKQHGNRFPKELEAEIRANALREIEFEELIYQEALRRKLSVSPSRLAQATREFKNQFPSAAEFQEYLRLEQGGSLERLRSRIERAILVDQVLTTDVTRKAALSAVELRAFYDNHLDHFRKPETVSIQTISLVIPDNATEKEKSEIRKRAEEALRQAKATKNYEGFGVLAEKVSEDDWRVMMGDHKSVHRGRMPPEVEKVVFSMKMGEVSDLIRTENSWCIARLNAREESRLVPFDEIRPKLKKDLETQKAEALRATLETRLRKGANVEEL